MIFWGVEKVKDSLTSWHVAWVDLLPCFGGEDDGKKSHDDSNDLKDETKHDEHDEDGVNGDYDSHGDHFHQRRSNPTLRSSLFMKNEI